MERRDADASRVLQRTGHGAAQAETVTLASIRCAHTTHPPKGATTHSRAQ